MTKRLAVVAHWDPRGLAAPHFLRQIEQIGEIFDRVIVASPAPLTPEARGQIRERAELLQRGNYGYDFGSWRDGLEISNWAQGYDEVLLTNDSYVGFFKPLREIMDEMSARPADVWGLTRTERVADHIQSSFLYFTSSVVRSRVFQDYWTGMKLAKDRREAILKHEVGISRAMAEGGFRLGSYFEPTDEERLDATRRGVHWLSRRSREFPAKFPEAGDNYFSTTNAADPVEANKLNWSSAFADVALDGGRLPVLKFDVLRFDPFWLESDKLLEAMEGKYPALMASVREYLEATRQHYSPREFENGSPAQLTGEEAARVRSYTAEPISADSPMPSRPVLTPEQAGDIKLVINSGVTMPEYYARQIGSSAMSVALTAEHYVLLGDAKGVSVNPLLDLSLLRAAVKKPGRPAIATWLRSRDWELRTSRVWWPGSYIAKNPRSVHHVGGPVGHLTAAVAKDPDLPVEFSAAAGRSFPWKNAFAGMLRSAERYEVRQRSAVARSRTKELSHPERLGVDWTSTETKPVVSVIMPVLNRPSGLRSAVESVQAQTWTDWELLIVDDGSDDDTLLVATALAESDSRIRVVKRNHEGVSAARNTGIRAATGDLIAFLDSDNTWLPHFLEDMAIGLQAENARVGYASLSLTDEKGTTYRNGAPVGADILAGNWIDLNVLVVEREAILEIGGFDTSLRRAVDYDLVIRLSKKNALVHIPTLGAAYDNFESSIERISTSEAYGWNTAVRLKNTKRPSSYQNTSGTTLVAVMQSGDSPEQFVTRLHKIRQIAGNESTQVLLAPVGCSSDEHNAIVIATATFRNIRVLPFEAHDTYSLVVSVACAYAIHDVTVVVDPRASFDRDLVFSLADYAREDSTRLIAPVALSSATVIHSVGATLVGAKQLPSPILSGHSTDELRQFPDVMQVPLMHGRTFAVNTAALKAIGGLDPLLTNEFELEDLSNALMDLDPPVASYVATKLTTTLHLPERRFAARDIVGSRSTFRSKVKKANPELADVVYGILGLEIAGWKSLQLTDSRPDIPMIVRRRHTAEVDGREVPRLRWSIKTSSPGGAKGENWGDTHFARSLAGSLRKLGQYVSVDSREYQHREHEYLDDVVVVLRGLDDFDPTRGPLSYMWLISHPDLVTARELGKYERVFAASSSWAQRHSDSWGIPIEALLQCTDPNVFFPEGSSRNNDVLFVGNSRDIPRPSVIASLRAGAPLKLYGGGWEKFVPEGAIAAQYVANDRVRKLYEQASIVLNDHWVDMAREGFISNRLFDAVAAGGRVVSDYVEGIAEIFAPAVYTYQSVDELSALLSSDVTSLFGSDGEVASASRRIRASHSFDARARTLLERAMEDLGEV